MKIKIKRQPRYEIDVNGEKFYTEDLTPMGLNQCGALGAIQGKADPQEDSHSVEVDSSLTLDDHALMGDVSRAVIRTINNAVLAKAIGATPSAPWVGGDPGA